MTASTNNKLLAAAAVAACAAVLWLATSIHAKRKIYEIDPTIASPQYRTDAARAIDAYENLMQRYMDITENNLIGIAADVRNIVAQLNSIDAQLAQLSARMARIEKALQSKKLAARTNKRTRSTLPHKVQDQKDTPPVR